MEEARQSQKGTDSVEKQMDTSSTPPEPETDASEREAAPSTQSSLKRLLLINGIVVAVILLAGIVVFFFVVRNAPVKALSQENRKLKAELAQLQELTDGNGEISVEVRRIEDLIKEYQPRLGPAVAGPIALAVAKHAHAYNIPPELVLSIINYQSGFELVTLGERGTVGLMQLSPKAYREYLEPMGISETDAFHFDNNIHLGCKILRHYLDQGISIETAITRLLDNNSRVNQILVGFTNTMIGDNKSMVGEASMPGDAAPAGSDLSRR